MSRRAVLNALLWAALLGRAGTVAAAMVSVAGLFPGKVLLSVDGGAPRSLAAGQKSPEGVTVVAIAAETVTLEFGGARRALRVGESWATTGVAAAPAAVPATGGDIVLSADSGGHYTTVGAINDRAVRFMVDTGASVVWISSEVANRVGIDYRRGQPIVVHTAGGTRSAFAVRLPSVRVGPITLTDVEGAVGEGAGTGETGLLGMSFLSRLSMVRDGNQLRLSQKEGTRSAPDTRPQIALNQKRAGLFVAEALVNGIKLPFMVDTGATHIALDIAMARRIGLHFEKGAPAIAQTANGTVRSWRVKLDSVSLGPITQYNVDATVLDGPGMGGAGLLGMSFLSRLEIKREGETMVLIKRF